ncbi:MAG: hypothetical protein ACR2HV_00290 [Acidimicrobiales bacterium]
MRVASLTARVLVVGLAGLGGIVSLGPEVGAAPPTPPDNPGRGMGWAGLAPGRSEHRCEGGFEIRGKADEVLGCTHGPDPAPAAVDPRVARATADLAGEAAALPRPAPGPGTNGDGIACTGDGTSGYRIEAIYAIAGPTSARPDRYAQVAPMIRSNYAPFVEWQFRSSAAESGGEVHVPFVTTANGTSCTLVVRHEVLTSTGDDSFSNTIAELKARGYNRADRRYMIWMDASVLCGIGHVYRDSQPGPANANNGHYTAFGRVDAACWGYGEGHELMHNLGGVQPDAPHATANFHCWDDNDEMCYDDDGYGPVAMRAVCAGRDTRLFDCRHDDYFLAGTAPAGTWLASHWNTHNSRFLVQGPVTETFSGSFTSNRRSITHRFPSGPGTITVTVNEPTDSSVTATVRAPDGSVLGRVAGRGTRTLTVAGAARGTYRLTMTGTLGSYASTVRHPA